MRPRPEPAGPEQESVWSYPRPPRLEPSGRHVVVELDGVIVADTRRALRLLETSHPPTWYLPPADVRTELLRPAAGASWCEWKGRAVYWDVAVGDRVAPRAAWSYPEPVTRYGALTDHLAFFAAAMDRCTVDGELALPQPGGFYGGWITADVVGPFKGGDGTSGW